jgi:hypothetical protein
LIAGNIPGYKLATAKGIKPAKEATMKTAAYVIPAFASTPKGVAPAHDRAANLAIFLLENTGSIFGVWQGNMKAADQRALFGRFLGKAWLTIDGENELVRHTRTVCFGLDHEVTHRLTWADIEAKPSDFVWSTATHFSAAAF